MRVGVLSFNVDSQTEIPRKDISGMFVPPLDIYVEMTQEDARNLNAPPLVTPSAGMSLIATKSMNFMASKQNLMLKVFSSVKGTPTITSGTIPLSIRESVEYKVALPFQSLLAKITKGAVWIRVKYNAYSFLFVNLHLPVNVKTVDQNGEKVLKNETLGYRYRAESLQYIIKELQDKIETTTFTVFGGDLNFRINPDGKDQLETLLQSYSYVKEFPFPDESSKTYTCKFLTKDIYKGKEEFESCRLTKIKNSTGQKECHDKERLPSRCDRFLYRSKYTPTVEKQESLVFLDNSDHNAMYLTFTLNDKVFNYKPNIKVLSGGKKTRKGKKVRRLEKTRKRR